MNIGLNKSLIARLLIILAAAIIVYSVFWFFKLGQVEKQINRFVNENSNNVSISDISVSGFPFLQRITITNLRFNLPVPALNQSQILVKSLQANAGIFQSNYDITINDEVLIYDQESKSSKVKFNSKPQITIAINDGAITNLSYVDNGYNIIDSNQKSTYSAAANLLKITSTTDENDRISFNINAEISAIEGFGAKNIYQNSFEKRIQNALKTGELAIGNPVTPDSTPKNLAETSPELETINPKQANKIEAIKEPVKEAAILAIAKVSPAVAAKQAEQKLAPVENLAVVTPENIAKNLKDSVNSQSDLANITPEKQDQVAQVVKHQLAPPPVIKSDFKLSAKYILTPNRPDQQNPIDIAQIQAAPMQYGKSLKINNLRFINQNYEINISGIVNIFSDDSLPSGGLTLRFSNFDHILNSTTNSLNQMVQKIIASEQIKPVNLTGLDDQTLPNQNNLYRMLLSRISSNLNNVAREISAKNAVSSEKLAQFDIRREKNLQFLVNETPVIEILGKF